jgi:hypothetical protein
MKTSLTLFGISLLTSLAYSGGAEGKKQGEIYSQLSYSPVATSKYIDSKSKEVEGEFLTRHKVENYGEIGIFETTTALAWNVSLIQQDIAGKSNFGLGSSSFGLQHQYLNSALSLGAGIATELPSPSSSESKLSHSEAINSISHFLSYGKNQANIHFMMDGVRHALAYDYSYTWQPSNGLYIKGIIRGQKSLGTSNPVSENLGLGLETEYMSPGVEAFYSISSNWHVLGALYSGAFMKNIYLFPGLKFGIAWTN